MASNSHASINQVLSTPALRTDLVTLVALISDSMRRDIVASFSPLHTSNAASGETSDILIEFSEESVIQKRLSQNVQRQDSVLNRPETQHLRRIALKHFDKWQIDVLRRITEALSVTPDAIRKARAGAKARAEVTAKAKRDPECDQWAGMSENAEEHIDDMEHHECIIPAGFEFDVLKLTKDEWTVVLDSVLLLLISVQHFSAYSRVLISRVTRLFQLPASTLVEHESKVAEGLLDSAATQLTTDASTQRQASNQAISRGVIGALVAPILAGSLGTLMGDIGHGAIASLLGPLATNAVLVGVLFGAYSGMMTVNIMSKSAGEIKDFKFLPLADFDHESKTAPSSSASQDDGMAQLKLPENLINYKSQLVSADRFPNLAISFEPRKVFSTSRIESFGLQRETDTPMRLSRKTSETLQDYAVDSAGYQLLSLLVAGLWPFGILRAASVLDNPSVQLGIAGVQRVDGVAGVENYDVTDMIDGHDKYRCSIVSILESQESHLEQLSASTKQRQDDRPSAQQEEDCALAREDEEGQIIIVCSASASKRRVIDFEPMTSRQTSAAKETVTHDDLKDGEDMPAMHTIKLANNEDEPLAMLDPEPEPELYTGCHTMHISIQTLARRRKVSMSR
ncbi:Hypothetical protein R9X50_00074900 [Acrodontium crateriforme]|uniref:Uncharacterized protein n=1 Tax=Acrodontium crateriforme TaxID=150365 RepID=A0AAQ3LYP3_9PEZI|nr:Hypothetical protein R9X50_00074900 [Acrodontium crateriforme]